MTHKITITEPIYLERVHNTSLPPLVPIPPHLLCQSTKTRQAQQKGDVSVHIYKCNSLLHYKKEKGFAMVQSCLLHVSLAVWGTHVTLRHRGRARVRVLTQPPTLSTVEPQRPCKASKPPLPLLLLLWDTKL